MSRWRKTQEEQARDRLVYIRDWFNRHREDRCACEHSPPQVWAEFFQELLDYKLAALGVENEQAAVSSKEPT